MSAYRRRWTLEQERELEMARREAALVQKFLRGIFTTIRVVRDPKDGQIKWRLT